MKRTTLLAATAVAALLAAPVAMAQDGMGPGMGAGMGPGMGFCPMQGVMDFATLDADADGLVTPAEVEALAASRFAAADTDGDGGLNAVEMIAAMEALRAERMATMAAEHLARVDDNGDGLLQATEIADRMPSTAMLFDRLDADSDGAVSAAEFTAAQERLADRRGEHRHGGMGGGRPGFWGWWNGDRQGQ